MQVEIWLEKHDKCHLLYIVKLGHIFGKKLHNIFTDSQQWGLDYISLLHYRLHGYLWALEMQNIICLHINQAICLCKNHMTFLKPIHHNSVEIQVEIWLGKHNECHLLHYRLHGYLWALDVQNTGHDDLGFAIEDKEKSKWEWTFLIKFSWYHKR